MPPAIVAFAAWASISVAAAYAIVAIVVISAGMAVYGTAQARRAERDSRNAMNAGMRDRLVTRVATEAPHRIIYGRAKVGSDVVAMFTSGDKDQFKHIVCVHAAHECDAIEEVYVNNVAVGPVNSDGDVTTGRHATAPGRDIREEIKIGPTFDVARPPVPGSVRAYSGSGADMVEVAVTSVSGRTVTVASSASVLVSYEIRIGSRFGEFISEASYPTVAPVVRVRRHLGGATDPADPYLSAVLGAKWPASATLRGLCYTVVTLDLNHPEFQGGLVPIHALIRGKKLYDPRTGLSAWSTNPALAIYDYLTSKLCGVPASDLPVAQFIAAANVCDEASNIGSEKKYTINGAITADQNPAAILESMTQCMAGGLVSTTWDVFAGKYVAPVASLTQDDVVGGMQITPGASDAAIYNGVKGQYISPENKHVMTDFKPYQNAVYRANDARDLYTNIDFPFTDALQRATNLARIFTEDQRNGFTIKAEFSLKAWSRKVGERITFTSAFLGQSAKVYRITDKSYSPNSAVQLTLKEDAASIWDFADATAVDSTPNTDLADPWKIADLAMISCTSGEATLLRQADGSMVPRIRVTWPAATTQAVFTNGEIEIEWRAVSSTTWEKVIVTGSETQAYLSPITPGYFYHVRARCVNPYLNTKSGWIFTTYQVQVFTARPVVYMWAANQPARPSGIGSYTWSTSTYAAPAGWSLTPPTAPTGGNESLWEASTLVSDISASGSTAIIWSKATVSAIGYAPSAAGAGPAGYSNARVFAYQRSASVPAGTPGAVNYDFTTGSITTAALLNGWLKTIPASDGNPLYVTSASASSAGTTDSIAATEWSGAVVLAYDGGAGTPGLNNATVTLYQRSASIAAPAKPSALATYTFATGALTGLNNGWFTYIPTAGGAYLHTTLATAIATTATDTIAATEWAAVQLMYDATDLIAARAAADGAQVQADAANVALDKIFTNGVLSRDEKPDLIQRYAAILAEKDLIADQAIAIGVSYTGFSLAANALTAYLTSLVPAWNDLTQHTDITRGVADGKWNDYYTAKVALLNSIASKAGTTANWTAVSGRPNDSAIYNNLVDLGWWKRDATSPWGLNGPAERNRLIMTTTDAATLGPKGYNDVVWYAEEIVGNSDTGGGWDNARVTLDPTKAYRFAVPIKRLAGTAWAYWGTRNVCNLNTAVVDANPYFASSGALTLGKWYLFVGYLYPAGSTGNTHDGAGVYDCDTGAFVVGGSNFNMIAGDSTYYHRAYQFYASLNASQVFGRPMVNVVDGTEPSLREYFSTNAVLNSVLIPSITAAQSAADAANTAITAIFADGVLDRSEKTELVRRNAEKAGEYNGLVNQAASLSVSSADYEAKNGALNSYLAALSPAWNDLTQNTNIVRVDANAAWNGYYTARAALQNAMAAKAATLATWAGTSGPGRPSDNATVGATWSTNITGRPTDAQLLNNQDNVVTRPGGGISVGNPPVTSGALKIRLPQSGTDTMLRFTVDIYEYAAGYSCTLAIAGYAYLAGGITPTWVNVSARVIGGSNVEYPVYFGFDGVKMAVWIGGAADTWSYPQVRVHDVLLGYSNATAALWENGWVVGFDTVVAANVTASVLDTYPAADWTKVVGAGRPANNATVGAPTGTLVGGTDAATVASGAAAGTAANAKLANVITAPVLADVSSTGINGSRSYATRTAAPSGGSGVYQYSWTVSSTDGSGGNAYLSLTNSTSATVTVKGSGTNTTIDGFVSCIITDTEGRAKSISFYVFGQHGTPL